MVSTRGTRYKFSEGERVLCYEPDPTKAKVLYDSKVLEVMESKDRRGRRSVEYLIHFQGWNSSWDRCVGEDFVLKDTEENRQLQRDLAEKSQLQLGAYLYRRERKKVNSTTSGTTSGGSAGSGGSGGGSGGGGGGSGGGVRVPAPSGTVTGPSPAKRPRNSGNFEDEGSSSSTQHDGGSRSKRTAREVTLQFLQDCLPRLALSSCMERASKASLEIFYAEAAAQAEGGENTDSSSGGSNSGAGNDAPGAPPPLPHGRANIVLPSPLRDRLTFDYHLVVKRGCLSTLPASPCVAEILESFVRWFARSGAWSTPGRQPRSPRATPVCPQRYHLNDVSRRLNLVREVADGLRVYFDYVLRDYLLYKQELNQYHELIGVFMDGPEPIIKEEQDDEDDDSSTEPPESGPEEATAAEAGPEAAGAEESSTGRALSPPRAQPEPQQINQENQPEQGIQNGPESPVRIKEEKDSETDGSASPLPNDAPSTSRARVKDENKDSVAHRLRSHKNSVTSSVGEGSGSGSVGGDEPSTSNSHEAEPASAPDAPPPPPSVASSNSSLGESWWHRRASRSSMSRPIDPPPVGRNPLSTMLDIVSKWTIVPRENTEHWPCRIYGAIHLSRLFVKLPDFLNAVRMPDMKLKLLLQYIDLFVQYLDEHREWFGKAYYMADSTSRSR